MAYAAYMQSQFHLKQKALKSSITTGCTMKKIKKIMLTFCLAKKLREFDAQFICVNFCVPLRKTKRQFFQLYHAA